MTVPRQSTMTMCRKHRIKTVGCFWDHISDFSVSSQISLLLLAAPTWEWGRCGRHFSSSQFCHEALPHLSSFRSVAYPDVFFWLTGTPGHDFVNLCPIRCQLENQVTAADGAAWQSLPPYFSIASTIPHATSLCPDIRAHCRSQLFE